MKTRTLILFTFAYAVTTLVSFSAELTVGASGPSDVTRGQVHGWNATRRIFDRPRKEGISKLVFEIEEREMARASLSVERGRVDCLTEMSGCWTLPGNFSPVTC